MKSAFLAIAVTALSAFASAASNLILYDLPSLEAPWWNVSFAEPSACESLGIYIANRASSFTFVKTDSQTDPSDCAWTVTMWAGAGCEGNTTNVKINTWAADAKIDDMGEWDNRVVSFAVSCE